MDILSASGEVTWTEDERSLIAVIQETVGEVGLDPVRLTKPPSAQVMYSWTLIHGSQDHWGVIANINASVLSFVDSIASPS